MRAIISARPASISGQRPAKKSTMASQFLSAFGSSLGERNAAFAERHADFVLERFLGEREVCVRSHPAERVARRVLVFGALLSQRRPRVLQESDATIRCGKLPRVLFEVISPSELQHKRQWDRKRSDLQAVEGVQEIVEIYQDEMLAHARETHPEKRHALADLAQAREREYPTYVQLGQFTVPTALRKSVTGLLTAPAITFWNIEKR